jgi:hypothetical protein
VNALHRKIVEQQFDETTIIYLYLLWVSMYFAKILHTTRYGLAKYYMCKTVVL